MTSIQIIPLGGLDVIGRNCLALRYGEEMIVIDAGMAFPEPEMLGIDRVIPDFKFLFEHKEQIKAVILTHGHEDHIGALGYLMKGITAPIYGLTFTLCLAAEKLKRGGLLAERALIEVTKHQRLTIGCFEIEFIPVNHSIPDNTGLAIRTPVGTILHSGDFKIDDDPVDGNHTDLKRFAEIGREGVLLLLADSTNIMEPGRNLSERTVGQTFEKAFAEAKGRIIVSTFASNVQRIQQAIWAADKFKRRVCVLGPSMVEMIEIAKGKGYLQCPDKIFVQPHQISGMAAKDIAIISTGSQGEPMSALARMAASDFKSVTIRNGDTVIISADPIPGNERFIQRTIDYLYRRGALVYEELGMNVHVSGHGCQEEIRDLHKLIKPKYFVPVHGEYRHMVHHRLIALEEGMTTDQVMILNNGDILEISENSWSVVGEVPAEPVLLDGLTHGDQDDIVFSERKFLSKEGVLTFALAVNQITSQMAGEPFIRTRGFMYSKEYLDMRELIIEEIKSIYTSCQKKSLHTAEDIRVYMQNQLGEYLYQLTRRKPVVMGIIIMV